MTTGYEASGRAKPAPSTEMDHEVQGTSDDKDGARLVPGLGLAISGVIVSDADVIAEACRWTSGKRGELVDQSEIGSSDLTPFVRASIGLGARVLATSADTSGVMALSDTVSQLAERAETAGTRLVAGAAQATEQVVQATVNATKQATEVTADIISTATDKVQKEMAKTVQAGVESVGRDLDRLIGSESAPVALAVKDIVARAMTNAQETWQHSLTTTLTQVAGSLDISNPASPLGALERRLHEQQERQHLDLTSRLDSVQGAIGATVHAAETAAALAAAQAQSPAKGGPYEERVAQVAERVATGMGGSFVYTAHTVGSTRACKKGDGVLEVATAESDMPNAKVVIECTTGTSPRDWNSYLGLAEHNRDAQASLGLVPDRSMVPGRELLAILTPSRFVMAFDPETDDPAVFRAALQLLNVQAQRQLMATRVGDLAAVDQRIDEARRALLTMQEMIKTAMGVRTGAGKIVAGLELLHDTLGHLLTQAQAGLHDANRSAAA